MNRTMEIPAQEGAAQAQAEARAAAQAARDAAREAAQEAAAAARAAQRDVETSAEERMAQDIARDVERALRNENISVSSQGGRRVIELPNGQKIIMNGDDIHLDGMPMTGMNDHDRIPMMALETGKQIAFFVCAAIAFTLVGLPIARAFARWLDRRSSGPAGDTETAARLSSIENAIEAVAVEVERISEGQRFTTRLLNERAQGVPVGAGDRHG